MRKRVHLIVLGFCFAASVASMRAAVPVTVRDTAAADIAGGGNSFAPLFSADGQKLVFLTHAANLVTSPVSGEALQILVRGRAATNTMVVSVGLDGWGGNGNSFAPSISSNGQVIVFASDASNLVANDTNRAADVFVRDLASGVTKAISLDHLGRFPADTSPSNNVPLSGAPLITANGRYVFFESRAKLGFGADTNNAVDVFRHDLGSNTTVLVSARFGTVDPEAANAETRLGAISPDGRFAVLISRSTDLLPGATNSLGDVYVRDMSSGAMTRVSAAPAAASQDRAVAADVSDDGRFAAFAVQTADFDTVIYWRDMQQSAPVPVVEGLQMEPRILMSWDGRFVVYEEGTNIFRFDGVTSARQLVNVATDGNPPANGIARSPVMTADGVGIVFVSDMPGLVTNSPPRFQIYARDMSAGITRLVSVNTNGEPSGASDEASLSAVTSDLSFVAFDSIAPDLIPGDGNRARDVFERDLAGGATTLVTERRSERPRATGLGHALLSSQSVSADGRYVVFSSYDTDLVVGDTNGRPDIFIHDVVTGATVTPGIATNSAGLAAISANGRFVVYARLSPVPDAFPFLVTSSLFRFDRESGTNELVQSIPGTESDLSRSRAAISFDGKLVAFRSNSTLQVRSMVQGTNLNLGASEMITISDGSGVDAVFTPDARFVLFGNLDQLFAYDLLSNRQHVVSGPYPGSGSGNVGFAGSLAISGNSRCVVFRAFGPRGLIFHDLINETNAPLESDGVSASVSHDGRFVAFTASSTDPNFRSQVFVKDRLKDVLELVSAKPSGGVAGPDFSRRPVISGDGRFVIFGSIASDLVAGDTNEWRDVFVRDRRLGTTMLLSRSKEGTPAAGASMMRPILAADGRTVVFHSMAGDLVAGDYNDQRDIFMLKLGSPDTDGDGLDDDWEVAFFDNLGRDGSGDFDGDGAPDKAEFLAGTDPTDVGSVFRVLTISALGNGMTRLLWSGNPNRSYRVEYRPTIDSLDWHPLGGVISWEGTTASVTDSAATNGIRFYRAVRLP